MSVISVNPDRALLAIRELNEIDRHLIDAARLPPPPPFSLLPHRTLMIAAEVEGERAALLGLAGRTGVTRANLAATNARIMIAAGQLDDPRLEELLIASVRPGGVVGAIGRGVAPVGGGLWDVINVIDDAATGATSTLFLGLYAHGRWTRWLAGEMSPADFRNGARALGRFSTMFSGATNTALRSFPKAGRFARALPFIGAGLTFIDSYGSASGRGVLSKGITAVTTTALTAHPAGAAIDFFTGGVITGSVNAILTLPSVFTGDTATTDAFTNNAKNGTYGPVFTATAGLGDGIAAAATGDLDGWSDQVGRGEYGTPLNLLHTGVNATVDKLFEIGNPFN